MNGLSRITSAGSWNGKYWYFRDAEDATKVALDQEGDLQWEITKAAKYDVTVNLLDSSISIVEKSGSSAISTVVAEDAIEAVYYNLPGVELANPEAGLYIVKRGDKVSKEIVR